MNNIYILVLINLILVTGFVLLYLYFTKTDNIQKNTQLNSDSAKYINKANKETFIELNKDYNTNDLINNYKKGTTDYLLYNEIKTHINNKLNESDGIISKMDVIKQKVKSILSDNVIDLLPIGTIIMWNNDNLPLDKEGNESNKWVWCDGLNGTPNLKECLPLGDNMGAKLNDTELDTIFEKGAEGENIESDGMISENNFPAHNHGGNGETDTNTHDHKIGTDNNRNIYMYSDNAPKINYNEFFLKIAPALDIHTKYTSHSHSIPEQGEHTHTIKINKPFGVPIEDQQPFYPRCSNINFIMKIS
jgi:hypothetical protein